MYRSKILQDRSQQAMTNMYDKFQSNESILLHDFFNGSEFSLQLNCIRFISI